LNSSRCGFIFASASMVGFSSIHLVTCRSYLLPYYRSPMVSRRLSIRRAVKFCEHNSVVTKMTVLFRRGVILLSGVEGTSERRCCLVAVGGRSYSRSGGGGGGGAVGGAARDILLGAPPGGAQNSSRLTGVSCCYAIGSFFSNGGAIGGLGPPSWW